MRRTLSQTYTESYRVYYEDTDAGGIVYYANYLKFAERARTEWLRNNGIEQSKLAASEGLYFVVRNVQADFISPARLDDMIVIETCLQEAGKVRMKIEQTIKRDEKILACLEVTIVCVKDGKPVRLPIGMKKSGSQ